MKTILRPTSEIDQAFQLSTEEAIRDGMQMGAQEGEAALETVEIRYAAELKAAEVEAKHIHARGFLTLQLRDAAQSNLDALGFNLANYLHDMARGRLDLKQAIALLVVSAALSMLTLLAFSPIVFATLLALVVIGSVASIEEFFDAYREGHVVREGIFFATSVIGLLAQFWLRVVRSKLIAAAADTGPVSHLLAGAGPIVQTSLGLLAIVIEILCAWKMHTARMRLLSPATRGYRERERLNAHLAYLGRALEHIKAAPEINKHYRIIGVRQQLFIWSKGAEQRARATHLKRAVGRSIALIILRALDRSRRPHIWRVVHRRQ